VVITALILHMLGGATGAVLVSRVASATPSAAVSLAVIGIVGGGAAGQLVNHFWPLITNQPNAIGYALAVLAGALGGVCLGALIAGVNRLPATPSTRKL
jgi:H+/Cl- antiporter ClcA